MNLETMIPAWVRRRLEAHPEWKKEMGRIIRFGITGALSTLLHYGIYCLMLLWVAAAIAYTIGYVISFACNYVMTTFFTFHERPTHGNALGFIGSHVVNYLLSVSLLQVFIWLGVNELIAPILVLFIAIPVNFLILRFVFTKAPLYEVVSCISTQPRCLVPRGLSGSPPGGRGA